MKYPEENIAKELHRELKIRFASSSTVISIKGAGVHWRCSAERENSQCSISCFGSHNGEYYTDFKRESVKIATSRISSRAQTIDAVAHWLDGCELAELHVRYPFVDHGKRSLLRIRDDVTNSSPKLERSAKFTLEHKIADIYYLRIRGDDRSCQLSFTGKNQRPDAKFYWDDCQLFMYQPDDHSQLADVLQRWISDRSKPSAMRHEFPWLKIGELADYYENGNPIEGEFIQSWERMNQFYHDMNPPFATHVLTFMAEMQSRGYNKTLRAGQSLWTLILSRSRRHGMRRKQACIQFWFHENGMDIINGIERDGADNKVTHPEIALIPEIDELLNQLQAIPID